MLPFSHFFHPRCMLSCLLFVVLTYTHCASQAPERSCRILACLSAQQCGGACFVFRVFLSRCTHIRKAFTKLEFPPKCCSSVFKRRDRGDGMCRTAKMGEGGRRRTNSFPLPSPPISFHPCWSSSYPSLHAVDVKLLLFVYFFSHIPLFISTIFHAGIGAFLFGASETQAPRRAVRIFFLVFSDMFGMVHIEV